MTPALPVIILMFPVGKVQMFVNVPLGLPPNSPQNALKPPTGSYLVSGGEPTTFLDPEFSSHQGKLRCSFYFQRGGYRWCSQQMYVSSKLKL